MLSSNQKIEKRDVLTIVRPLNPDPNPIFGSGKYIDFEIPRSVCEIHNINLTFKLSSELDTDATVRLNDLISGWEVRQDSNVVDTVHFNEEYRVLAPLSRPRKFFNKGSTYYAVSHKLGFTTFTVSKTKTPSVSVLSFSILEKTNVNPSSQTGILYITIYTKSVKKMSLKESQLRIWYNTSPPYKKMTRQMVVIAERESLTTTATRNKPVEIVLQGGAKDCLAIAVLVSVDDETQLVDKLDSFEFLRGGGANILNEVRSKR